MSGSRPAPASPHVGSAGGSRGASSCVRGCSPCEANRSARRGSHPPREKGFSTHWLITCSGGCSGVSGIFGTTWRHDFTAALPDSTAALFGFSAPPSCNSLPSPIPAQAMYTSTAVPVRVLPVLKAPSVRPYSLHRCGGTGYVVPSQEAMSTTRWPDLMRIMASLTPSSL